MGREGSFNYFRAARMNCPLFCRIKKDEIVRGRSVHMLLLLHGFLVANHWGAGSPLRAPDEVGKYARSSRLLSRARVKAVRREDLSSSSPGGSLASF